MNQFPLIKINIIFIIGIIIQNSINTEYLVLIISACVLLITGILFSLLKFRRTLTFILMLLTVLSGSFSYYFASSQLQQYPFSRTKIKDAVIYGSIINIQPAGAYQLKFRLHADSVHLNNKSIKINHDFLCSVRDTMKELKQLSYALSPGNYIAAKGILSKPAGERNPGEFNYYNYLHRENISGLITLYNAKDIIISHNGKNKLKDLIYSTQLNLSGTIDTLLNNDAGSLLKGLILADRSGIDPDIIDNFINSGVIHILSVSGLHIGYIVLIFIFLTGRISFKLRVPLIIAGIIMYTAVTGAPPSVVRAALMSIIIFIALLSNRSTNLLNTLSLACLLSLIYNPLDLFHPGFQLSYAAVAAIALFYYYFGDKFKEMAVKNKVISGISVFFLISLFAQIGTLPFTVYYFGKISLVSLLANIFVIPGTGLILGAGIFMLLLNSFWFWGAGIYASCINFMVYLLYTAVHLFSDFKWSYIVINNFTLQDAVIFYFLTIFLLLMINRFKRLIAKFMLIPFIVINIIVMCSIDDNDLFTEGELSVMAIDVGQGDAFLIKFPNGKTALIDAGESSRFFDTGEKVIMPLMERLHIENINCGFITHMDSDHYEGFLSLLENAKVDKIIKPEAVRDFPVDVRLEQWLQKNKIPVAHYEKKFITEGNVRIYMLNNPDKFPYKDMKNRSGVVKLVYGKTSILFMGDTEIPGERALMTSYGSFLKSDILKLGHHGSKNATSEEFLYTVRPAYALISSGRDNRFNHPSPETLLRLGKRNVRELRTDISGAVLIRSDGEKIEIVNWKK